MNQRGFASLVIIVIILVISAGVGGFLVFQEKKTPSSENKKTVQQEEPSEDVVSPIEPTPPPAQFIQTPKPETQPELKPQSIQTEQQTGRDPKFEEHSQRLYAYGIDCTHENTYSMRNALVIDSDNSNIIYAGIEGRGVYKSINKGLTWKKIIKGLVAYPDSNNLSELCFPDIAAIYIDSADTQRLLMVTSDITTAYVDWPYGETGGIWESTNGGESWRQMLKGEINVAGSGSLAIDPKDPQVMYYPVNPDPPTFMEAPIKESLNIKSSVYKTVNGGKTWEEINIPMLPGLQALVTAIDPRDSNHLLFFTQSHDHIYGKNSITEVFLHKQHGVMESFDAGRTWTALGGRVSGPYI